MNEKMKQELNQRLNQLKQQRDLFVQTANQRIAFMNGQIALLEELLAESDADQNNRELNPKQEVG